MWSWGCVTHVRDLFKSLISNGFTSMTSDLSLSPSSRALSLLCSLFLSPHESVLLHLLRCYVTLDSLVSTKVIDYANDWAMCSVWSTCLSRRLFFLFVSSFEVLREYVVLFMFSRWSSERDIDWYTRQSSHCEQSIQTLITTIENHLASYLITEI